MRRFLFLLGYRWPNRRNLKPTIRLAWMSGAISKPEPKKFS